MRVTVLGCGGSNGVPTIGNIWGVCDPANPKNRRLRPSVLMEADETVLLIDTTPDLRAQLLAGNVHRLTAVLYTHAHADHTHGIDELREINRLMRQPLDIFADRATLDQLTLRFDYCFAAWHSDDPIARPLLVPHAIDRAFRVGALTVIPFEQDHGYSLSLGFRIGGFAYSTDVKRLPEPAFEVLEGVDVWIVDCQREYPPHPVHSHLSQTLDWIARVRPRRAILTHMGTGLDYDLLRAQLPPHVEPGYDGQVIEVAS